MTTADNLFYKIEELFKKNRLRIMLETRTIIQAAGQKMDDMQAIIEESSAYEIKGILNSEILFFITIADFLNVDHVIESGRARGQSTELIARFLKRKGGFFDSIEYDDQSQDVSVCARRMSSVGFKVNMLFGNAFEILPNLVRDSKGGALFCL